MSQILADLFVHKVTRDIPPVVYFHEQSPDKVAAEVAEYIVTGGWPPNHPHHKRVPQGIHEQYVKLLTGIVSELDRPGGPDLPTIWISGFYGSGKSSFAKLLGLSLDGLALPDGRSSRPPGSPATPHPTPPSSPPPGPRSNPRSPDRKSVV